MNFICKNISQKNQTKAYMKNAVDYSLKEKKIIPDSFVSNDFLYPDTKEILKKNK